MFWFGLLLSICFVPGYTGASVPTQWAVLALILPLSVWRRSPYNPGHTLLFLGFAYALLSALWSLNLWSWGWGVFLTLIWLLAFHWGTLVEDLRPMWKGIAMGLSISTAVAIAQALDYAPVEVNEFQFAGLFYNSTLFGVLCGLVLVALACERLWWYTPPVTLGLIVSGSRGGLLLLAFGLTIRFGGLALAASAMVIGGLAFTLTSDLADAQRLQIWGVTLNALNFFGHGAGSFLDLYFVRHTKVLLIHPEYVHNDILQLLYELGPATLCYTFCFAMALVAGRHSTGFPVLASWCLLSAFYFPLYTPLTAFLGLVMAGHAMRSWVSVRALLRLSRSDLLPRHAAQRPIFDLTRREALSFVPRTTPSEG